MILKQHLIKTLTGCLTIICLMLPVFAQAQDAIGRVIQTSGVVTAVDLTGAERRIARGSEIFATETITTGPRGSSQIRLSDGAVISLETDSFFTVDEYEFDGEGGAADSVVMTIARGTMRTLTGVIGDDPADTYELNTPFASIGVRGTEYGVVVEANGRVRVFVFDGSVSVAPSSGGGAPTVVGLGGQTDAVDVEDNTTVRELAPDEIPAGIQEIINNMDTRPVTEDAVNALPSPDVAVQVQVQRERTEQEQEQETQQEQLPGGRDAAGVNVDPATGTALNATTETEVIQARTVIIISVSEDDPDAFDPTIRNPVSPN